MSKPPTLVIGDLARNLNHVNLDLISRHIPPVDRLKTRKDQFFRLSDLCRDKALIHPEWSLLAGRVKMFELKENVPRTFSIAMHMLRTTLHEGYYQFVMRNADELNNIIKEDRDWVFNIHAFETLHKSYFARLRKSGESQVLETPQYMYLRVATYLWFPNMAKIRETYKMYSYGHVTQASPTLFNAGLKRPQLASCFLMNIADSMTGLTKSWKDCAFISKHSGGIGIDFTALRHSEIDQGGYSRGIVPWVKILNEILCSVDQAGKRKGSGTCYLSGWHIDIEEFMDLRKATGPPDMRARDLFYALWLSDEFMGRVLRDEEWTLMCPNQAKGLDTKWGLEFDMAYRSYECKAREGKLVPSRTIRARELWQRIITTQIETGMPFILYKDAINRKSNQKNLGTICLSNLCVEITLYTDSKNIASCNLASLSLNACIKKGNPTVSVELPPTFEKDTYRAYTEISSLISSADNDYFRAGPEALVKGGPDSVRVLCNSLSIEIPKWHRLRYGQWMEDVLYFDFQECEQLTRGLVRNLNQVIDRTYYPEEVPEIRYTNLRNRPLGIGVQGLADVFALLDLTWTESESRTLNTMIFETMYYGAVSESVQQAREVMAYETFAGSPASKGLFQFDLWDEELIERELARYTREGSSITPDTLREILAERIGPATNRYDWESLRRDMVEYGMRNSMLLALMPTASSAGILGNTESFEPCTQHIYARTVLSGQFIILNKHMIKDLKALGLWNSQVVRSIIKNLGSVAGIEEALKAYDLSEKTVARLKFLKQKYLTVFEIPQKALLTMALDADRFVCQTRSRNCWMAKPTYRKLNAYHFYGWQRGAKTGMYYLRQTALTAPINMSLDSIHIPETPESLLPVREIEDVEMVSSDLSSSSAASSSSGAASSSACYGTDIPLTRRQRQNEDQKERKFICDDHTCCSA